jgi:hypothetical protein
MGAVTGRLRAWLAENPTGRLSELYEAHEDMGIRAIDRVIRRLERRGELLLPDPTYRYKAHEDKRMRRTQETIWAVIRSLAKVRRVIDPEEVVLLSGASPDYVRKYVASLVRLGYVERRPTGLAVLEKAMTQARAPICAYKRGRK